MGCAKNDERISWKKLEVKFFRKINLTKSMKLAVVAEQKSKTLSSIVNMFIKQVVNDVMKNI